MAESEVAIVDCGGTNIASLTNALGRLGVVSELTRDARRIGSASHVILPGVGAAADAMQRLADDRLVDVIRKLKQPVLGICLGMQLLAESSEEESVKCLGIVPAAAKRLRTSPLTPVPNMGWCRVKQTVPHELFTGINNDSYFYFVHSYAMSCAASAVAAAEHAEPFTAALVQDNFFATQFHPERSAAVGAKLLRNFLRIST